METGLCRDFVLDNKRVWGRPTPKMTTFWLKCSVETRDEGTLEQGAPMDNLNKYSMEL